MPKTPDEIKKGLECHTELDPDECSGVCPYSDNMFGCIPRLCDHALAYIQQLEKRVIHLEALNQSNLTTITMQERTRARLQEQISQLEAERDAAVKDMYEAQSIVCLICKNHYQPDPAVKKYGCKEFGEHWIEDGVIVCGMFEWRGVQKGGPDPHG